MIPTPLATGHITYKYPKLWICSLPITEISAVAPPGGCKIFVINITKIAVATASPAENHRNSPTNKKTDTPTKAESKCPPMVFFTLAKGLLGAAYNKTAVAPKEPIYAGISAGDKKKECNNPTELIPSIAPSQDDK